MIAELKTELNIHGDETSWRVNGANYWLWAFVGKWTVIYEIDKSRAMSVPKRILKGYNGNITSDSYGAWNHLVALTRNITFTTSGRLMIPYSTRIPDQNLQHLLRILRK